MTTSELIVISPPGVRAPGLAIAAHRAGGIGCLRLEPIQRGGELSDQLAAVASHVVGKFAVAVDANCAGMLSAIFEQRPTSVSLVIVDSDTLQTQAKSICQLREVGLKVVVVLTHRSEFELVRVPHPSAKVVDGVILKGNESGGRVSETTTYILCQQWCEDQVSADLPFWVQGCVGTRSVAAARVAGACGVVLDSQLLLARESGLDARQRQWVRSLDGSESVSVGNQIGIEFRICAPPGSSVVADLGQIEDAIVTSDDDAATKARRWFEAVEEARREHVDQWPFFFLGPDASLAASLADEHVTVAGIMQGVASSANRLVAGATKQGVLSVDSKLAASHQTRYPVLQGPMTRVSDVPAFAKEVATAGGLPFLALALLREAEVDRILAEATELMPNESWGVGLLGFLPPEIRAEQIRAIKRHAPPFAIIAGGRPDQAAQLEQDGITTYLHVPSPGLMGMFLKDGAKRFILEGRECGGHVGPRTSFLLWEQQLAVIRDFVQKRADVDEYHIVFAGGIHDGLSAAMAVAMAGDLAELGVRVGVLMGTAYLFTQEAVTTGAIVPQFQSEVQNASETVLFQTGPGHAVRCVKTPYYDVFQNEKLRLRAEGKDHHDLVASLERMNIGRLRVASKGLDRQAAEPGAPRTLVEVDAETQRKRGMYMVGQVASLRSDILKMSDLHQRLVEDGQRLLSSFGPQEVTVRETAAQPCDVAIVGMSCFYPGANSLQEYWDNILHRHYAVEEVPATHWDWRLFYDADPRAKDKIISKWGGFLGDIPFDPLKYGITPKSLYSIEPLQLLLLEAMDRCVNDAGYGRRPFDRENTCAVLGIGGGGSPMGVSYGLRASMPMLSTVPDLDLSPSEILDHCEGILPEWTEDSFPGFLMNVAVGRIANRFDLGGSNYALDAACASSLSAVHACIRELALGTANVAFAMGADTVQTPYAYMAFSKTHALSPQGRCRPFDQAADGIVLSEGLGIVMLKRLADAERDGDRIYAVIRGIGSSSDGRDKGLTAPNAAGQTRALRRAYRQAGISPSRVGLIEAHGTGTVVGDRTESQALTALMVEDNAQQQSCALGSVKSMIGHSKCAAGIAGLIKATMALHHKVLPPTLAEEPNEAADFPASALFLNTETRPWIHDRPEPRCAGVSAFGFGGTNVHAVLEEYRGDYLVEDDASLHRWTTELCVFRAEDVDSLRKKLQASMESISRGPRITFTEYAAAFASEADQGTDRGDDGPTLAIIAESFDNLAIQLQRALELIDNDQVTSDPRGIYYSPKLQSAGRIAMLFPGQGSQYPNMLSAAAVAFDVVRGELERFTTRLLDRHERPLSRFIYPPSSFNEDQSRRARMELAATEIAQPAIGAASAGMFRLLTELGIAPDVVGGHSYGEYTALWAANAINSETFIELSHARGQVLRAPEEASAGGMAAVSAGEADVREMLADIPAVTLANLNAPDQTVISGPQSALDVAIKKLDAAGVQARRLQVSRAFHSPELSDAESRFAATLQQSKFHAPNIPVYANHGAQYDDDPQEIVEALSRQITSPVRFVNQIDAMYADGVRVFIEVGPLNHLTGLVQRILGEREHLAVATDSGAKGGIGQLQKCLAQLIVAGVRVKLKPMFAGRVQKMLRPQEITLHVGEAPHSPTTWIVNGIRSRPWQAAEPRLLGQTVASTSVTAKAQNPPTVQNSPQMNSSPAIPPSSEASMINQHVPSDSRNGQSTPQHTLPPQPLPGHVDPVMLGYQELMSQFLDAQRDIMLQYLGGQSASSTGNLQPRPPAARATSPAPQLQPIAEATPPTPVVPPAPQSADAPAQAEPTTPAVEANGAVAHGSNGGFESMEQLTSKLLAIVSERTGYPTEMLDLDLELEADLGVDSIKRVEILGELAEGLDTNEESGTLELEKLTTQRSLRGMLDYLEDALFGATSSSAGANGQPGAAPIVANPSPDVEKKNETEQPESDAVVAIQRAAIEIIEAEMPAGSSHFLPSGVLLITDDEQGLAVELADQLADFGQQVCVVRMADVSAIRESNGVLYADLTQEAQVEELVRYVQQQAGHLAGLIHLLPLKSGETDWATDSERDTKSLYLLCRAMEEDLVVTSQNGNAILMTVTAQGGVLGFEQLPDEIVAGQGGILGFTKCVAMEWPEVMVRAVDLSPQQSTVDNAAMLLDELRDAEGPLEIGRDGQRRITWNPVSAPLHGDLQVKLDDASVILLTGGARGITAEIALDLANRFQPTLILVGRSPWDETVESGATRELQTAAEIKRALIDIHSNGTVAPMAEVEAAYRKLMRNREMTANIEAMRAAGARVEYHSIDVRDEASLAQLIRQTMATHQRLDGVVHGAGVIEDRLVRDKTPESFDRVFTTKVRSAAHLVRHLPHEQLKFLALFSSAASRYGNRGQADYAAANEVLSKLAAYLDGQWAARVVSICWGPWSGTGMVADLESHLTARGLTLIPPRVGSEHFINELQFGRKGESEIIIGGGAENLVTPTRSAPSR